jgi:hypothetical protein
MEWPDSPLDDITQPAITALLVCAAVLFPAFLFVYGEGYHDWLDAAMSIADVIGGAPSSVYDIQDATGVNPRETFGYVYLPSFAALCAVLLAPVGVWYHLLPPLGVELPSWYVQNLEATAYLVLGGLFFTSQILTAAYSAALFKNARRQVAIVLGICLAPTLFLETYYLGPNIVMTLLFVAGIYYVQRARWFLSAILIGFATFKFIGLPVAIVLFGYALMAVGRRAAVQVAAGGIVSQIPNLLYFLTQPDELLLIIRERGAISTYSNTIFGGPLGRLIQALGIEDLYINAIWPLLAVVLTLAGIYIAVRIGGPEGLVGGFATAYISTSYLLPAERRLAPLIALAFILIMLAERDEYLPRRGAIFAVTAIVATDFYRSLFSDFNTGNEYWIIRPPWFSIPDELVVVSVVVFVLHQYLQPQWSGSGASS